MDISYTLIVALMFITILSFGFANILTSLGEILDRKNNIAVCTVHLNWILILLIIHFNMAWHAVLLATNSNWTYDTFLFVELGPILAFFATRILAPSEDKTGEPEALKLNYTNISQQFFVILAFIQAYAIGSDLILDRGFTGSGVFNILLIVLSLLLIKLKTYKIHVYGAVLAWCLILSAIALRSFGVIS